MTYDDWKTQSPYDNEKDNECIYCGIPCHDTYCSRDCYVAEIND